MRYVVHSRAVRAVVVLLSWGLVNTSLLARGQETSDEQQGPPPSWTSLSSELTRCEQALLSASGYRVEVRSKWTYHGQAGDSQGEHSLSMATRGRDRLHFEAREGDAAGPQLVIDYAQPHLVRWSPTMNQYSRVETDDARMELQSCGLTQLILKHCAVEFLLMPHARETVLAQITRVSDLGHEDDLHHFEIINAEGHRLDVWFSADPCLPRRIRSQELLTNSENQVEEFTVESRLEWQLLSGEVEPLPDMTIPEDALLVADLFETMNDRGVESLIGQSLPKIQLTDLTGEAIEAASDQQVTLLYFWATWAAPSVDSMPSVFEFRETLVEKGVRVLPVNVAEDEARIRQFLELNKFAGETAVDPTGEAVHELRITQLPAVVIVGADGRVHDILQNVKSDMRTRIAEVLDALLRNK